MNETSTRLAEGSQKLWREMDVIKGFDKCRWEKRGGRHVRGL